MKRVDFIIGGVQRGGTTALFEYLKKHPALASSSIKETHFFDKDNDVDWAKPNYESYHSFFPAAAPTKLWFEATPIYIFWPSSLERIKAYRSDIKLIFLFRDPIERAWSHWSMEFTRGRETLDFSTAIRAGRARIVDLPPNAPARRVFSYIERGFYADQVTRVLSLFRAKQILLLASEALRCQPGPTLRRIADFLGVPPFQNVKPLSANVRADFLHPSTLELDDAAYLREIFAGDLAAFQGLTEIDTSTWLCWNFDRSRTRGQAV